MGGRQHQGGAKELWCFWSCFNTNDESTLISLPATHRNGKLSISIPAALSAFRLFRHFLTWHLSLPVYLHGLYFSR